MSTPPSSAASLRAYSRRVARDIEGITEMAAIARESTPPSVTLSWPHARGYSWAHAARLGITRRVPQQRWQSASNPTAHLLRAFFVQRR